jgi:hypothetical protein
MQSLLRRTITAAQVMVILIAAGFLVPATGNDIKDLAARASGNPVPQCASWSVLRPLCRR